MTPSAGRASLSSVLDMPRMWPDAVFEERGDGVFRADVARRDLPRCRIEEIIATPHLVTTGAGRTAEQLADVLTFDAVIGGVAIVAQAGARVILRAGDVLLRRTGSDRSEYPDGIHLVRVVLASDLVPGAVGRDQELFDVLPASPITEILVGFAQSVLLATGSADRSSSGIDRQLEQALLALTQPLVVDCLLRSRTGAASGVAVRAKAEEFIANHVARAGLSADDIATGLGISRRWLFRAFAGDAEGLAPTIKRIRVDAVKRQLLVDPRATAVQLAERTGFRSGDQLRRAFRAHHGAPLARFRAGLGEEDD